VLLSKQNAVPHCCHSQLRRELCCIELTVRSYVT
jgi:hypothetical protein